MPFVADVSKQAALRRAVRRCAVTAPKAVPFVANVGTEAGRPADTAPADGFAWGDAIGAAAALLRLRARTPCVADLSLGSIDPSSL